MASVFKMWKYPVDLAVDVIEVTMPISSRVKVLQLQAGVPCIWVEAYQNSIGDETRKFVWVGTGHEIPDSAIAYIGTVQIDIFVWHLYELES